MPASSATGEQGALGKRTDNACTTSAKYAPAGKMDCPLGVQHRKTERAAVEGSDKVRKAVANASTAKATASASRSTLQASAFDHFDNITEVYIAADCLKLHGGYKLELTIGFPTQAGLAVGLRTRF